MPDAAPRRTRHFLWLLTWAMVLSAGSAWAELTCVVPFSRAHRDSVSAIHRLPGGDALIGTTGGLFRYSAAASRTSTIGSLGRVGAMMGPVRGDWLVQTDSGLYRLDPATSQLTDFVIPAADPVQGVFGPVGGDLLVGISGSLLRYDVGTSTLSVIGGVATGEVYGAHELSGGVALIAAEKGLFRYDPSRPAALSGPLRWEGSGARPHLPVGGTIIGPISALGALSGGRFLIGNPAGLINYDPRTSQAEAITGDPPGAIRGAQVLSNGEVLIMTEIGLHRLDMESSRLSRFEGAIAGTVTVVQELQSGELLVGSALGVFRREPGTSRLMQVGGQTGPVTGIFALPDGSAMIGGQFGLFRYDPALSPATVVPHVPSRLERARPSADTLAITLALRHRCAAAAFIMPFQLRATGPNGVQTVPARVDLLSSAPEGTAHMAGDFVFDRAGEWQLALLQDDKVVGEPLRFSVGAPTLLERARTAWPSVAGGFAAIYAMAFAALLALSHRSTRAFRILTDSVWAKFLTWPFFLLRHVPCVQRWVLEPWFQEVRRGLRRDVPFLDPPAMGVKGQAELASTLLPRLKDQRRLWLQGRSGMGKSSVFAAWERAYFADPETLSAAAARLGFILIMAPVRHYAGLPMDPNRPEAWVVEVVRQRFERFGLGELDAALVRAMLRAGHIAIALDGMNEAERDPALMAFARQFPMVPLLVTSQTQAPEGWESWQLPRDVADLRSGLLKLWLGAERGELLDRRIQDEGLAESIVSGYDLVLVKDLAEHDPAGAVLPRDRTTLYRAMLNRVRDVAGEPLRPDPLRELAWNMVLKRRREISREDAAPLGAQALASLTREGVRVLRQVGSLWEFRHDQMRAFLAASWLAEDLPGAAAIQDVMTKSDVFTLARREQQDVWRFLSALLTEEGDLKALWLFAGDEPDRRGLLLAALQEEANRRGSTLVRTSRHQDRTEA